MKMKMKMKEMSSRRHHMWVYPEICGINPSQRWGHSASFAHGLLYVFGGCCGGLHFGDVLSLDLKTMVWRCLMTSGAEQVGTRDSHSATIVDGNRMVVFGGTNGTKKINDLHILNLNTREWSRPATKGSPPSPRESHSATLVVLSDGLQLNPKNLELNHKKLELNRKSLEFNQKNIEPNQENSQWLVVFGGSGEGEGNYLNDVHILDLSSMTWFSPEVKGELPTPRDSHTAVAVGKSLVVYGGDCGDHYIGEVDVLDLETFTWSKLKTAGSTFPGVRAGHSSVAMGSKVYVIGGVGERAYYNDVWTLDMNTHTWSRIEVAGPQPQGRFSHSSILVDSNIVTYGGCGEDERPLDEVIILHMGSDNDENALTPIPMCKFFSNLHTQEHRKLSGFRRVANEGTASNHGLNHAYVVQTMGKNKEDAATTQSIEKRSNTRCQSWKDEINQTIRIASEDEGDAFKRRKLVHSKKLKSEPEQEEHSHSNSQQSSPSESEQEHIGQKSTKSPASSHPPLGIFLQQCPKDIENEAKKPANQYLVHQFPVYPPHSTIGLVRPIVDLQQASFQVANVHPKAYPSNNPSTLPSHGSSQNVRFQANGRDEDLNSNNRRIDINSDKVQQPSQPQPQLQLQQQHQQRVSVAGVFAVPNMIGTEVRGMVDGVFDSGYLMTAQVNGRVFRGLLFSPGPALQGDGNILPIHANAQTQASPDFISPSLVQLQHPVNNSRGVNPNGFQVGGGAIIVHHPPANPVWGHPVTDTGVAEKKHTTGIPMMACTPVKSGGGVVTSNTQVVVEPRRMADPNSSSNNGQWVWHPLPSIEENESSIANNANINANSPPNVMTQRGNVQFIALPSMQQGFKYVYPMPTSTPGTHADNNIQGIPIVRVAPLPIPTLTSTLEDGGGPPSSYSDPHAGATTLSLAVPGQRSDNSGPIH